MAIEFYSKRTLYSELSNFSNHAFEIDGKHYPTVEHYFQAMKFPGHEQAETIRTADNPMVAKQLGRTRKVPLRSDWEAVKLDIMRDAVRAKFTTHPELRELLLGTGDETLVEAAPRDYFWGCGAKKTGQNWLGKILMEVRDELRNAPVGNESDE
ncbi:NADAR family protein [Aeoliella mucimassa]|uniref:Swarming motility protein YbiA n=1 Tax=Aeoliella mucimassa TaxID=2527972 RepID=A0A518APA0_9BACT|nr:NADAR family protein [Aeoliella mucimassa]QDU56542.1 Swarming motility protein YbiA [Aeoliella mucimassa]